MVCVAFECEFGPEEQAAFEAREAAYVFARVPYGPVVPTGARSEVPARVVEQGARGRLPHGLMCLAGDDETFRAAVGEAEFERATAGAGGSAWDRWGAQSGLEPAPLYLRHCVLAARALGAEAAANFEGGTLLADRRTSVAEYLRAEAARGRDVLAEGEEAWRTLPVDSVLRRRFGG